MGLANWRSTKVRKDDVEIAKNYLSEKELLALNNLVEQYLVFAEGQAMRHVPIAMDTANKEYEKYSKKRQIAYDKKGNAFDALVNQTKKLKNKSRKNRKKPDKK